MWAETLKYDYFDAIEWAGSQPFCNGKVGLLGCSYYAITQWIVAQEQPPHLACLVMWEGAPDLYADMVRLGGIMPTGFFSIWMNKRCLPNQYGIGELTEEELKQNRVYFEKMAHENPTKNEWWKKRSSDLSRVTVPLLLAGNWFCSGCISKGNIGGFQHATSENKWLEMHIGSHFTELYTEESRALQKKFLDYWLKGIDTGLMREPKIKLALPQPVVFIQLFRIAGDKRLIRKGQYFQAGRPLFCQQVRHRFAKSTVPAVFFHRENCAAVSCCGENSGVRISLK